MSLSTQTSYHEIAFCPKGETISPVQAGDFILLEGRDFIAKLIKFGQSIRMHGKSVLYTKYTHAALIVDSEGRLIESLAKGTQRSHLDKYQDFDYYVVRINASLEDRYEAMNFATACLREKYAWTTIVSIAISLLMGLKFSFGFDGQEICSGLVARSLERTSAIFPRDPSHITPADLAQYYNVPVLTSS